MTAFDRLVLRLLRDGCDQNQLYVALRGHYAISYDEMLDILAELQADGHVGHPGNQWWVAA